MDLGGMAYLVGHATWSRLSLVAPLMCYNLSRCFSCKNINDVKNPDQIEVLKVPETSKYKSSRFFVSWK
jgi:hypothetical protein